MTSCTPSIYVVATDTNFEQVQNQPNKKKIIYLSNDMDTIENLNKTATNLNRKKWSLFEKDLLEYKPTDQIFLRSVKALIVNEYLISLNLLDLLDDSEYDCQVSVLKTDCLYELQVDSVDFKNRYQQSLNCTEKSTTKQLIKTRYRFLRYDQ